MKNAPATKGHPLSPGRNYENFGSTMGQSDVDYNITSPPKPHFKSVKDYLKQAKTAQKEKNDIKNKKGVKSMRLIVIIFSFCYISPSPISNSFIYPFNFTILKSVKLFSFPLI